MKPFIGLVIKVKTGKTVAVLRETLKVHPVYKKRMKVKRTYQVHDEIGVKKGDKVKVVETRPISLTKKWKIMEVIKK